jgi:Domain of unknown function (DUF4326)
MSAATPVMPPADGAPADSPPRVQRRRIGGCSMPAGSVYVGRGPSRHGRWGNFAVGADAADVFARELANRRKGRATCVQARAYPSDEEICRELAGRVLVCWCRPDHACHADELRRIASGVVR